MCSNYGTALLLMKSLFVVLPEVSFSADEVVTHYGASLDLTCTVTGYPVNFSVIRDKHGSEVPGQIRKKLGEHSVKTFAVIGDAMEGEYVCSVETHYMGELVGQVEKSVSVLLYSKLKCAAMTDLSVCMVQLDALSLSSSVHYLHN